ncbi:hypothetical protein D9M69_693760 [compost metagenome]
MAQGQTNSTISMITSSTGQEKRSTGERKPPSERPLENQMIISLSRYMRDRVETMATKSASVRMVGMRPSTV